MAQIPALLFSAIKANYSAPVYSGEFMATLGKQVDQILDAALKWPSKDFAIVATFICFYLYWWLDLHFIQDAFSGIQGEMPKITCNEGSGLAAIVLARCSRLKRRFWPTPWLCSPHLQTCYLHFFGYAPKVHYRREMFRAPDGGTIGLDWLDPYPNLPAGVDSGGVPVVLIIPGLTSDSNDSYIRQIAAAVARNGWRALVANHRGLGGVSLTSDTFYNAGFTKDVRTVLAHVQSLYPNAKLVAIGTSLGANILIKYLGEEGSSTPVQLAAAIGCPWDLMIADRFMNRRKKQLLYNLALTYGLKEFARVHKESFSRIANWEHLFKAKTVREFDDRITRLAGGFQTVDTYYRRCSSAQFVPSVNIPLLCISAMDDPICTKEAIPWDECRDNPNVILVTSKHGGHLAYMEGLLARSQWWVGAVQEFIAVMLDHVGNPPSQETLKRESTVLVGAPIPTTRSLSVEVGKADAGPTESPVGSSGTSSSCSEVEAVEAVETEQPGWREDVPAVLLPFKDDAERQKVEEVLLSLFTFIRGASGSPAGLSASQSFTPSPHPSTGANSSSQGAIAGAGAMAAVEAGASAIAKKCPAEEKNSPLNLPKLPPCCQAHVRGHRELHGSSEKKGLEGKGGPGRLPHEPAQRSGACAASMEGTQSAPDGLPLPSAGESLDSTLLRGSAGRTYWQLSCLAVGVGLPIVGLAYALRHRKMIRGLK